MTLSNNTNGKVIKTAGKGYSPKRIFEKIISIIGKENVTSFDIARTGSRYIEFKHNGVYYILRIADHTKRLAFGEAEIASEVIVDTYEAWIDWKDESKGKEKTSNCEYEILNTASAHLFYNHLTK